MADTILQLVHDAVSSPWFYVLVFAIAAIDAFFPAVPSETTIIIGGVFAYSDGSPDLLPLILAGAAGAFVGDHISYQIGKRGFGRFGQGRNATRALDTVRPILDKRGGMALLITRFIPGGRTATTLTMGGLHFPRRRFAAFDAIACLFWATYSAAVGYLGGAAFEDSPWKGLTFGLALAIGVAAVIELVRWLLARYRGRATSDVAGSGSGSSSG